MAKIKIGMTNMPRTVELNWEIEDAPEHGASAIFKLKDTELMAQVRFDGCVNIWNSDDDGDAFHICDLPKFIEQLKSLAEAAQDYYPGPLWRD